MVLNNKLRKLKAADQNRLKQARVKFKKAELLGQQINTLYDILEEKQTELVRLLEESKFLVLVATGEDDYPVDELMNKYNIKNESLN